MKNRILLVIVILLVSMPRIEAQSTLPWIEEYTLINYSTGQIVLEWSSETGEVLQNAPVLAGDEYRITFTLNVRQTLEDAVLTLTLSSFLYQQSESTYWEVGPDFPRTPDFNPATRTISLHHTKGVYTITAVGKIASDVTVVSGGGLTLHHPVEITLVKLDGPKGIDYDNLKITVIDNRIDAYRFLLNQKEAELQEYRESNVDPAYVQLYENFLALAEQQAEQGLVDNAIDLLNTLDVDTTPVEVGPSWKERYFIPVVGGLGLAVVLGWVLFIRTNSKLGFVKMLIEDQIREMEALQSRAQRIDRNLAQRLDDINTRLKETEKA